MDEGTRPSTRRSWNAATYAVAALVGLCGCADRPQGFITAPQAAAFAGGDKIDLLVVTTRSSEGAEPGQLFTGERGSKPGFADVEVSIPPIPAHKVGEVEWPSAQQVDPTKEFVALKAERLDRDEALRRFYARLRQTPKRQVLVFVHGYNTRFPEAIYRFAQIVHDTHTTATPVLFTWPSRGEALAYPYDRESANYSRDALENLLQVLSDDKSVGEISILAHSMGNWVMMEALRQMAIRDGRLAPKIKQVILAAPDVDVDIFRQQLDEIGDQRPSFTVFVSQDDRALAFSKRFWSGGQRLGAIDPHAEPYRSQFDRLRVNLFDLTDVESPDSMNHGKFASAPEVVQLIGKRLAEGQTFTDTKTGLNERAGIVGSAAASMLGSAASIVADEP